MKAQDWFCCLQIKAPEIINVHRRIYLERGSCQINKILFKHKFCSLFSVNAERTLSAWHFQYLTSNGHEHEISKTIPGPGHASSPLTQADPPGLTWVTNSALIWDTVGATIFLGCAGAAIAPVACGSGADQRPALAVGTPESFQAAVVMSNPELQKAAGWDTLGSHSSSLCERIPAFPPEAELVGPEVRASVKP